MRLVDLTGKKFGRLTVIRRFDDSVPVRWWCRCDCGVEKSIRGYHIGRSAVSCGCFNREKRRTHGMSKKHPLYATWTSMRQRCNDKNNPSYKDYGGRGIRVCRRWDSFEMFVADIGPRPSSSHTLERKDTNGNYTPKNVRWATRFEQAANMRTNRRITLRGITKTVTEWARDLGLEPSTVFARLYRGWSKEKALTPRS